jgi:hypothetical protein
MAGQGDGSFRSEANPRGHGHGRGCVKTPKRSKRCDATSAKWGPSSLLPEGGLRAGIPEQGLLDLMEDLPVSPISGAMMAPV